jgi:hypothetical protein
MVATATPWTVAASQQTDTTTTWLDWGSLAFLIKPDTANGVQLWVIALVDKSGRSEPRTYVARFDPAVVLTWLGDAELMLLPNAAGPNDPPTQLATPRLGDLRHGTVIAARRREHNRWSKRVLLSFQERHEEPLTFSVEGSQAKQLFEEFSRQARQSHLTDPIRAASLDQCGVGPDEKLNAEQLYSPQTLYPPSLLSRGIPGLVAFRFIVDTTGRAAMDQDLRVLYSTDPAFTVAARDMLARSTFKPATRNGHPVSVPECFAVNFWIRHH